jgi:hypothetical protein
MFKLLNWVNIEYINWTQLYWNINAIHLLEQNLDKVNWGWLSLNENAIFDGYL